MRLRSLTLALAMGLSTTLGAVGGLADDYEEIDAPRSMMESRATIEVDEYGDPIFHVGEEDLSQPLSEEEQELIDLLGEPREVDGMGHVCEENEPTLAERCYEKDLLISSSYEDFERQAEEWIATCVMSRTIVNGKPIRRERGLVRDNGSLLTVWATYPEGETIPVAADFCFEGRKVVSIDFF